MAGAYNKPFVMVTEDDICEHIADSDTENTKKQIIYAVSRMDSFAVCAGETCLQNMTDLELDNFLARFYAGLRKAFYAQQNPCTRFATAYIHKHFQSIKGININIINCAKQKSI